MNHQSKLPLSIYIHYPFCVSKCPYCDFNSYCNIKIDEEVLLKAYLREIEYYREILLERKIETIFFGGGTPSLMGERLLEGILQQFKLSRHCEVSLEANPNSITLEKLQAFKRLGINRLSIGVQSLKDEDLQFLGRIHSRSEALKAVEIAQKVFETRYSIDLIYARPHQRVQDWEIELQEALRLSLHHISCYQLIIEKGTPFYKNKVQPPNEDLCLKLYESTMRIAKESGLSFYEISNFATKGHECKHNMVYWSNGDWLGIGAGASGRLTLGGQRIATQNLRTPADWCRHTMEKGRGFLRRTILTSRDIAEEAILMGLRTTRGLTLLDLQKNLPLQSLYEVIDEEKVHFLQQKGLLRGNEKRIVLTRKGFLVLNSVIEYLS
jgi:oxygen-independent coproporphyrinogen-3 oxidase